jgi:hypothetical protein
MLRRVEISFVTGWAAPWSHPGFKACLLDRTSGHLREEGTYMYMQEGSRDRLLKSLGLDRPFNR